MAEPDEGEGDEHSTMGTALMAFHATLRSNESVVLTQSLTLTLTPTLTLTLTKGPYLGYVAIILCVTRLGIGVGFAEPEPEPEPEP